MKCLKKIARQGLAMVICGGILMGGIPLIGAVTDADAIKLELENIYTGGDAEIRGSGADFSGGFAFINVLDGVGAGKTASFELAVPTAGEYDLTLTDKDNIDRGIYQVSINEKPVAVVDFYNATAGMQTHSLGRVTLADTKATLTLTCLGSNDASSGKCGLAADYVTLTPATAPAVTLSTADTGYTEQAGKWTAGEDTARFTEDKEASAMFMTYPPVTDNTRPRFDVMVYLPTGATGTALYTIQTMSGRWTATVDQAASAGGWYKLATVDAAEDTAIGVTLTNPSGEKIAADRIAVVATAGVVDAKAGNTSGGAVSGSTVYIRVNQIGYDADKSKRATIVNVENGTFFTLKEAVSGRSLYSGMVQDGIADFTAYKPTEAVQAYIECAGVTSYTFTVAKYLMQQTSVDIALDFMEQSRSDAYEWGAKSIGWRDSHQFCFEMSSLVQQYMANPAVYDRMPYDVYRAADCEYPELRVQDEPNIVWLMEFAALRYYDLVQNEGKKLHMLVKEQLAWFLYAYPYIDEYVPEDMYKKIRDLTIRIWSESGCNLSYHSIDGTNYVNIYDDTNNRENNNLFAVQDVIGGIKGQLPPGHAIAPNLMMYEVLTRDGLAGADAYFKAAYDNCEWVLENIDIADPAYSKGQRMSEHIVMENLAYFLEEYPDKAPEGLKEAIAHWAETMIARADNLWDMRMASSVAAGDEFDAWTGAAWADLSGQYENCAMNEPGNMAGLQAAVEAACRVIDDPVLINRLKAIGVAAIDDMFGRNPNGRSYFFNTDYLEEFAGGDLGWFQKHHGGNGVLGEVVGRIDGSPKEAAYKNDIFCNPSAAAGYTEAWVAYNTAWNASLAYSAAADTTLSVSADTLPADGSVTVTLKAPLNMDPKKAETGEVRIINKTTGKESTLTLTENSADDYAFSGELTGTAAGDELVVAYGYGQFEQTVTVTVTEGEKTAVYGDVDQNGEVQAADALLALQAATDKVALTADQEVAADVDGEAGVSANDALMILQYSTKKIGSFPVE